MSDGIAQLGITVDSSSVKTAATALGGLTAAAQRAQPAVTALTNATAPANAALATMSTATEHASTGHAVFSTQAMAASHSMRSMIESIIAGASPVQALSLQLGHLSYAASSPGGITGAFSEAIGVFTRFLTPMVLISGGLIGIGVAAYAVTSSIARTEIAFGDLAERAQTTVGALHNLQAAAQFKGIDSADFTKAFSSFADASEKARNNIGALGEALRANGYAAGTFDENISHAADIIKNTQGDAAKLAMAASLGLPAQREWVQLLGQGSAGLKAAMNSATQFGAVADEALIKRARDFDQAWSITWKNFADGARNATISAIDFFSHLAPSSTTQRVNDIMGAAFPAGQAGKPSVNLDNEKQRIALQQPMIGKLGAQATVQTLAQPAPPPEPKHDRDNRRQAA